MYVENYMQVILQRTDTNLYLHKRQVRKSKWTSDLQEAQVFTQKGARRCAKKLLERDIPKGVSIAYMEVRLVLQMTWEG